jgi:hypothetical protein
METSPFLPQTRSRNMVLSEETTTLYSSTNGNEYEEDYFRAQPAPFYLSL